MSKRFFPRSRVTNKAIDLAFDALYRNRAKERDARIDLKLLEKGILTNSHILFWANWQEGFYYQYPWYAPRKKTV